MVYSATLNTVNDIQLLYLLFQAFTKAGDQLFSSPTFRYYSSNSDKANLLMANVEDEIVNLQNDQQNMDKKYKTLQQSGYNLTEEIRKNNLEEKRSETQIMKIGDAVTKLRCVRINC